MPMAASRISTIPAKKPQRTPARVTSAVMPRRYRRVPRPSGPASPWSACASSCLKMRMAAQGETMKATASEKSMAAVAPVGMGLM